LSLTFLSDREIVLRNALDAPRNHTLGTRSLEIEARRFERLRLLEDLLDSTES
jgi:hypothetical protein